ncbi:hypothetical protein V6N13_001498 [Hibiscus sabdariffa]
MVERLGFVVTVNVFWQLSDNPLEVKKLISDGDVLEMVRNVPRDHYLHIYIVEVEPDSNLEDEDCDVEPETRIESDSNSKEVEPETRIESDSNSEDEEYEVEDESSTDQSKFSDSENELASSEDEIFNVNVGLGSDEVEVESENESGQSDSLHSVDDSDSEGGIKKARFPEFIRNSDLSNPRLKAGMIFASKKILKEAIKMYSIKNRYCVKLKRNDNKRIQVKCKGECLWMLWATPVNGEDPATGSWQIRSVNGEHTCLREFQNHNVTAKWLAENYFSSFYVDPSFSHNSLKQAVHKDWGIHVPKTKCIREKNLAIENLNGNHKEQYAKLYAYLDELRQSNPGTTTVCKLDERKYERLYICMQAMKDGFKAGCRPIIGLDGCHLKGYFQGHLLAAVGIDADDSIYPISFAVVESENQSSWCWFLELLATDLEIENSHSFTFMTDRQKTSGVFIGKALKDQLWKAARATYVTQFQSAMDELKVFSEKGWQWLSPKDPTHWLKSHFSLGCKSDMLLNNNCECFNKLILEARDKPIITLIESIRTKLMQRLAKRKDQAEKWTGLLCPKIQKKLDNATSLAHSCWPLYAGGQMYQVSCCPSSQHSVNIQEWTCSCRKWQLTGIPCIHAISVILSIEDRPKKYVDPCYSVSTQRAIYSHLISPVRGEQQWATNDTMEPILPPIFRRPPGRPHKKRKREADEAPPMTGKVSKRGMRIFCKKCGGSEHNIRTCKGKVGANPKRPGQTSSSAATKTPRIPKLPLRRPGPRTTPTSQAKTTQTPSSTSTEPTQPNVFRWMPTLTVRTSQESSVSHSSPSPTPIPTQPSHPNVFIWMPTPGVPLSQDNCGSHLSPSPSPTPIPTPKPLSQDNCGSQSSPRIDH